MKYIALTLILFASFIFAESNYKDSKYILSGPTESGEFWQIYIRCNFDEHGNEIVTGVLELEGNLYIGESIGQIVKATLEPIVYYGDTIASDEGINGWYFKNWPRTCSYLPN